MLKKDWHSFSTALLLSILILSLAACTTPPATGGPTRQPQATGVPTPKVQSTGEPTAGPTTSGGNVITLLTPRNGESVSSPVAVSGSVTITPFESTLRGRVYDAAGQVIGEGPIMVNASMGEPGDFDGQIPYTLAAAGGGRVEVAEVSSRDGSVVTSATTSVQLAASGAPAPTSGTNTITIDTPKNGDSVSNPVSVSGSVAITPFESTLRGRIYDSLGQVIGEGPIMVNATMGEPGNFSGQITYSLATAGAGRIEIAEISPRDGSVMNSATVSIQLAATSTTGMIEVPAPGAQATLPLHILARVGQPGQQVNAVLRWDDGSELARTFTLRQSETGGGLLVESLWWNADVPPQPFPVTQPATLEVQDSSGAVLASQQLVVISWDDTASITQLKLYFLIGEQLQESQVVVPKTEGVGRAALEELLWGPPVQSEAGFSTAIPMPQEVLAYPGRGPDWGPRVRLLGLTIDNGVATANFSKELKAYGGGSARVQAIRSQITQTLTQFPTVKSVVIAIEGETEGVLEP